jgi:sugar lactone lactonase YvrE
MFLTVAQAAHASFSLTFQGLVRDINSNGSVSLQNPAGIVVDPSGNTYVADTGNNRIVEFDAHGIASVLTISGLSPSLSSPSALALDGSGNLYIADTANSRVVKVSASGSGSVVSTGSATLSSPRGVALDPSGNLFIADTGNNRIVEVTSGGSAAALTITVSSGTSTLSSPMGLAVDTTGKLYIADSANNRIVTVAPGSTTGVVASILGGVTLSAPKSVAVDRIGNLMIADSANDRIAEIDTSGNGTVLYTGSNSLNGPVGVAVDPFGTISLTDTGDSRVLTANPPVNGDLGSSDAIYSLNQSVVGFGHVLLGSSTPVTLNLSFTTGQVGLGAVKVFTSGVQNLDFTSGSGTTCSGTTSASTLCTVQVSFLPTAPGLRNGAVVLFDTSLNPILTIPLYGFGDAPIAGLAPNTGSVISSGSLVTSNPYQVALDGAGNLYVGDYTGKNVTKIPAGGGSASVVSLGTPGSIALQDITGVAVDGAGNLFIGDHQNSRILVMTPGGVVSVLSITGLTTALGFPTALNFDAAGNLYIADFTGGRVVEVSTLVVAGSTSSGNGTVVNTGSYSFTGSTLTGLTVDSQSNIYLAARTQNNSSIIRVTNSGVASALSIPGNITPAISNPQGVAADAMGNIYIVDTANSRIVEITTAGVASAFAISGLSSPSTLSTLTFGVTADPYGNLYIPDWSNNRIVFVNVSGATLSFASTNVGSTSNDSPKTATVTNLGNRPLLFSAAPNFTPDFVQNGADSNPCTGNTSLAGGVNCNLSTKFTPQSAGSLNANILVTNNSLNVTGSTQQVTARGVGINAGDTTSTLLTTTPSTAVYGQQVTIGAKIMDTQSGHATTIPNGSVSFIDSVGSTVTPLGTVAIDASGNATLPGIVLSVLGSHTITASYVGVTNTFQTSSNSNSIVIGQSPVTVAGTSAQPVSVITGRAGSIGVTVTGAYAASVTPSGAVGYNILNGGGTSILSGTAPLTAGNGSSTASITIPSTLVAGTYTVNVSYGGDTNYQASTTPVGIALSIGKITPKIAWNVAGSISYGSSLAGVLVATASDGSTSIPGSFTYTATISGGAASAVVPGTILGGGTYSLTATFTPTDTTSYAGAAATATLVVSKASASISLVSSTNPSLVTGAVTFTAAISSSISSPTGSVQFYDGTTLLGSGAISLGKAAYTTANLATGSHSMTAIYSGDSSFTTSTSAAVVQLVQDFTLTFPSPGTSGAPSATVLPGGTATYALSIGPSAGTVFPGPITLSVSGLPSGAIATLTPQTLPAGSGLSTVTLTIQVPQQTAALNHDLRLVGPALALLLLPFVGRIRRSRKALRNLSLSLALCLVGGVAMLGLSGCGARNTGYLGVGQQTYTVVITATSGNLSHSTSVSLTVQ